MSRSSSDDRRRSSAAASVGSGGSFPQIKSSSTRQQSISSKSSRTPGNQSSTRQARENKTDSRLTATSAPRLAPPKRVCNMSDLPDELLLKIFGFLAAADLLGASVVDKRWQMLTRDNLLWRHIYTRHKSNKSTRSTAVGAKLAKGAQSKEDVFLSDYWRRKFLADCTHRFDPKPYLSRLTKGCDPFTKLPSATSCLLEKLGLHWVLAFVDAESRETFHFCDDSCRFSMTVCVRWFQFVGKLLTNVRRLRVYAARPILHDSLTAGTAKATKTTNCIEISKGSKGQKAPVGPCQKSLIYDQPFCVKDLSAERTLVHSDDTLVVHALPGGIILALWKSSKQVESISEVAFCTMSLHFAELVHRCLLGTPTIAYVHPSPVVPPDEGLDRDYGLHGYSCAIELRNHRTSFWRERFDGLHCRRGNLADGCAVLQMIDPRYSHQRSRFDAPVGGIALLWRTELFKGKLSGVCIMDVTLLDEHQNPMWCCSMAGRVDTQGSSMVYEYDGDVGRVECGEAGRGEVSLVFVQEVGGCYINNLSLRLRTTFINGWFGTRY